MWYYKRTESQLWTVGFDGAGGWTTDSDHDSKESAAERVAYLNGVMLGQSEPKHYAVRVNGKANIRKVAKVLLDAQIYFQVNPCAENAVIFAVFDWTNGNGIDCPGVLRQAFHEAIGE